MPGLVPGMFRFRPWGNRFAEGAPCSSRFLDIQKIASVHDNSKGILSRELRSRPVANRSQQKGASHEGVCAGFDARDQHPAHSPGRSAGRRRRLPAHGGAVLSVSELLRTVFPRSAGAASGAGRRPAQAPSYRRECSRQVVPGPGKRPGDRLLSRNPVAPAPIYDIMMTSLGAEIGTVKCNPR
jgi:hypothetical protein